MTQTASLDLDRAGEVAVLGLVAGVPVPGVAVDQLPEGAVAQVLRVGVPGDRLGQQPAQRPAAGVHRLLLGDRSRSRRGSCAAPPRSASPCLLVHQDHPAPQLFAVLRLEGFLQVLGGHLDLAGAELPQGEGRVDDVPGVLRRADAALLVQGAQPALAADAEPLGDRFDLLIDLGRRDLIFCRASACSISMRLIMMSRIFFPLPGHALVGQLLAGDHLAVDEAIGSVGLTGIAVSWTPGTWIVRRFTGLLGCRGCAPSVRGTGGGISYRGVAGLLGTRRAASRPSPGRPGRTRPAAIRDRDPLRSSRGVSPIPWVPAGNPSRSRDIRAETLELRPESVNRNSASGTTGASGKTVRKSARDGVKMVADPSDDRAGRSLPQPTRRTLGEPHEASNPDRLGRPHRRGRRSGPGVDVPGGRRDLLEARGRRPGRPRGRGRPRRARAPAATRSTRRSRRRSPWP